MAHRLFEVGIHDDGLPHITLQPGPRHDFEDVDVVVPPLLKLTGVKSLDPDVIVKAHRQTAEFQLNDTLDQAVWTSCGNGPDLCGGSTRIDCVDMPNDRLRRFVVGASVTCNRVDCPLDNPPGSEDNEPLAPTPTPPSLSAHAKI